MAAARKSMLATPVAAQREAEGLSRTAPLDLARFDVVVRGSQFTTFFAYHRGGLREEILQEVAAHTRGGERAFVLMGDFNTTPHELQQHPWVKLMRAVVVSPQGHTCTAGAGRTLDLSLIHISEPTRPY